VIAIPRALARSFRAVLRRSLLNPGPRGCWPLLLCRADQNGLVLQACQGDMALRYHLGGARPQDSLAFRASVLAEFEGRRDDPVELEQVAFGKGRARWVDCGVPRVIDLETVVPDGAPGFPGLPRQLTPMPVGFVRALDEAAKTTARESARFALSRLQLRGKSGEIIATDGRQLLVQGGFAFPWTDTVLVPRLPAFGIRELAEEGEVAVGRTKTHVALQLGRWTFLLAIDARSRFPDVDGAVPRITHGASRLRLDPQDAAFLAATLPGLPGSDHDNAPVTLDLHAPVAVRSRDEKCGRVTEVTLSRSTTSGPPVRLCMNRGYVARAMKLGFTEVEVPGADKPLVCRDGRRVYVWMPLDRTEAVPPGPDSRRISSAEGPAPLPSTEPERREAPMPAPQANGPTPDNGRLNSTEPERWSIAEVIAETETLRGLLHDASARTARLLAALKHQRRRSRAVQQAMQSLKDLRLDH
jgi:hypothetical protein